MTSICLEGMGSIVFSASGVSLLPTFVWSLVIDIRRDVCGVNDSPKREMCVHIIEMGFLSE